MKLFGPPAGDTIVLLSAAGPSFPHSFNCDRLKGAGFRTMTLQPGALLRGLFAGFVLQLGIVLSSAAWPSASMAQKLVDPNAVAPEYRAAAEKRRAEQIRLLECSKKADVANVAHRDRAAYVNECLEK
jgi:hypothetical protein